MVDSTLHPDTGLPVPLPFRMSAFVPTNLIIIAGMLMPNPSLKSVIFWQWANQSLNGAACCSQPKEGRAENKRWRSLCKLLEREQKYRNVEYGDC